MVGCINRKYARSNLKTIFKKLYDYFELFIKIDSEFLPVCCVLGHLTVIQPRRNKFSKVFWGPICHFTPLFYEFLYFDVTGTAPDKIFILKVSNFLKTENAALGKSFFLIHFVICLLDFSYTGNERPDIENNKEENKSTISSVENFQIVFYRLIFRI